MLIAAHLWIDEESDRSRKRWTPCGFGQTLYAKRSADPDLAGNDSFYRRLHAGQLTGSSRQDKPPSCMRRKARVLQPVAQEFKDFLDPRLDDGNELRFGQMRRTLVILACRNHRNRLAFIGNRCK